MNQQLPIPLPLFIILTLWSIAWKGIALWRAANLKQRNWFVLILVLSGLLGIPEILYLFFFSNKKLTLKEMKSWIPKGK